MKRSLLKQLFEPGLSGALLHLKCHLIMTGKPSRRCDRIEKPETVVVDRLLDICPAKILAYENNPDDLLFTVCTYDYHPDTDTVTHRVIKFLACDATVKK
jgi:hypothetical protein